MLNSSISNISKKLFSNILLLIISSIYFSHHTIYAKGEIEQVKLGNLAVIERARPNPMFSLGQNIVDKNDVMIYNAPIYAQRCPSNTFLWENLVIYGLTDRLSMLLTPAVIKNTAIIEGKEVTCWGFTDLWLAFEYWFTKKRETWSLHNSIVASIFLPTGSFDKKIPTGLGSPSFLIGSVLARFTSIDWYIFADTMLTLTTKNKQQFKGGNALLFEAAVGHNLKYIKNWILLGSIECNGIVTGRDTLCGAQDPDTGGTVLYLGPTIYAASNNVKIQTGFQWAVAQKLFGLQDRRKWRWAFNLGFMFNTSDFCKHIS